MPNGYEKRVFECVSEGVGRTSQIVRRTCLGHDHVKRALSNLRRERKVELVDGQYRIARGPDEQV